MVVEFLGTIIVLAAWILEMNRNLKRKDTDKRYHIFLVAYIAGFALLAFYSAQIENMVFAFFNGLLALITLLEFAFFMVKRH